MIFLDTSAIYALADSRDLNHQTATQIFGQIIASGESLLTHNYVVLECITLIQARLGLLPALKFAKETNAFEVEWVDSNLHESGIRKLQSEGRRQVSLVDHISFLVMTRRQITTAFAFDPHFKSAGFRLMN